MIVCVPGRSGCEPDAASPCGSLKERPVSYYCSNSNSNRIRRRSGRWRDRRDIVWKSGFQLTVLDDGLVVLDRLLSTQKR